MVIFNLTQTCHCGRQCFSLYVDCVCVYTHIHTLLLLRPVVVGTGERMCNALFDYQSSLVHYAVCPLG
jgi:hypothetical protein